MKIALINIVNGANAFGIWNMGLVSLMSYLHANSKHRAEIVDGQFDHPLGRIIQTSFDTIGLSAMTAGYEDACKFAKQCRLAFPKKKIIIGGVHISTLPQSMRDCFDVKILGEGEQRLIEWMDGVPLGRSFINLENYPPNDYSMIDKRYFTKRWLPVWEEYGVDAPILTSRGCPYRCIFCSTSRFWNKVRFFTSKWVVNDIATLATLGATVISIQDDMFSMNKRRLKEIVSAIQDRGLNKQLKFVCNVKSNTVDDEMCCLFNHMGVKIVNFGFESGNDRMLEYLKCGSAKVSDHMKAIKVCHKHGLRILGSFIMGEESETYKEKLDTVKLAYKAAWYGADSLWHIALTPFPGTPIWDKAKQNGTVSDDMDFNSIQMFKGPVWDSIPFSIHAMMFVIRAFMKIRRKVKSCLKRIINVKRGSKGH